MTTSPPNDPLRVLDTSVVLAALTRGQFLPEARELATSSPRRLVGPSITWQEFGNATFRLERRGLMSLEEGDIALRRFSELGIAYFDAPDWLPRSYAIARKFRQPRVFDAIYLVCAEDLDAELWTCDRKFVMSFGPERPGRLRLCPDDVGGGAGNA